MEAALLAALLHLASPSVAAPPRTLQDLLSGCPAAARRDFLKSLVLADGMMAGAHFGAVEGCLGEAGIAAVLKFFKAPAIMYNNKYCIANECAVRHGSNCTSRCGQLPAGVDAASWYLSLADHLKGCSKRERGRVLDGLRFTDGKLEKASLSACPVKGKRPR